MHDSANEPKHTLEVSNITYVRARTIIKSGCAHVERLGHLACSKHSVNASRPREKGSTPGGGGELWRRF